MLPPAFITVAPYTSTATIPPVNIPPAAQAGQVRTPPEFIVNVLYLGTRIT